MFNSLTFLLYAPTLFPLSLTLASAGTSSWMFLSYASSVMHNLQPSASLAHNMAFLDDIHFNALLMDYLS